MLITLFETTITTLLNKISRLHRKVDHFSIPYYPIKNQKRFESDWLKSRSEILWNKWLLINNAFHLAFAVRIALPTYGRNDQSVSEVSASSSEQPICFIPINLEEKLVESCLILRRSIDRFFWLNRISYKLKQRTV